MDIQGLLDTTIKNNASDLHLLVGIPPSIRCDGELKSVLGSQVLTPQIMENMIYSIITPEQKELFLANKELDLSYGFTSKDGATGRFRVNLYFQKGSLSADFRFLPPNIRTPEDLHLPKSVRSFTELRQGFVLVCGPTGHGKSTTLAALINEINLNKARHILTIEDPIEYVYPAGKSIISQREMGIDTHSWTMALRAALREDPDVVLVGEMRDAETMGAAITIAETGHLVFSTLHTNSAAQSIDRIVDSFPAHQQGQIRIQLASVLKGIVSQRLLPRLSGGRIPATEILIGNNAIASNIREGKTHLIDSIIQTSQEAGMLTLDTSLASLVRAGEVALDVAEGYSIHPDEFSRLAR